MHRLIILIASTWSPFVAPNSVLGLPCFAAIRLMLHALALPWLCQWTTASPLETTITTTTWVVAILADLTNGKRHELFHCSANIPSLTTVITDFTFHSFRPDFSQHDLTTLQLKWICEDSYTSKGSSSLSNYSDCLLFIWHQTRRSSLWKIVRHFFTALILHLEH